MAIYGLDQLQSREDDILGLKTTRSERGCWYQELSKTQPKVNHYTTVSDSSPVAMMGMGSPRSGLCSTNCSCLLAFR